MQVDIRRLKPEDTADARRLWDVSFSEGYPDYSDWYFRCVYRSDWTLGLYEAGTLVSNLQMVPYTLSLRGDPVRMDTLSGVATDARFRNRGHAKALMAEALRDMARRRLGFTFLYPFNHGFYQRLGWETCSASLEVFRPSGELPEHEPHGWSAERMESPDAAVLSPIYEGFMESFNCRCLRGEANWAHRFGEAASTGGFVLLARYNGVPAGYALCEMRAEDIEIVEMAYARTEAVLAVLAALKPYGRAVTWTTPPDDRAVLLPGVWKDRVKLQPHVMFRVTDVPLAFSQAAPACEGEAVIEVSGDNMVPENNGRYLVTASEGQARAARTDREPQFSCGIGTLARILTGYMDAGEAAGAGLAAGETTTAGLLARMYPGRTNFLFELY